MQLLLQVTLLQVISNPAILVLLAFLNRNILLYEHLGTELLEWYLRIH